MATATTGFGARLQAAMRRHGPLCAGLDPHRALVEQWGLTYDVAGLERFALTCVEAFAGRVAAVKPQSAFFEVFGSRGIAVLERVLAELREAGTLTILDAKRGDIGSTMTAYAEAYLGDDAVAPADALTVSPYLGYESLRPAIDLAAQTGRGLFVLALTSNPEGRSVQHATRDGRSVAASVVDGARGRQRRGAHGRRPRPRRARHRRHGGRRRRAASASTSSPRPPRCSPRASGPRAAPSGSLAATFGPALGQVLASSSREILAAGPDPSRLVAQTQRVADRLVAGDG